jgi:hypothetical protein
MEEIVEARNMNDAYKRAKKNKGAPGVDGMTVYDMETSPYPRKKTDRTGFGSPHRMEIRE